MNIKKLKPKSILSKVVLGTGLPVLIFSIITSVVVFQITQIQLEVLERENIDLVISQHMKDLNQIFINTEGLTQIISQQDVIIEFLEEKEISTPELLKFLKTFNQNNQYSAVYLLNKDGKTLVSTDETFVGKDYSFRPYFEKARSDGEAFYVALGITSGQLGIYQSKVIYSNTREFIGVIVIKTTTEFIRDSFEDSNRGYVTDELLLDHNGVILISKEDDRVLKTIGKLDAQTLDSIKLSGQYPSIEFDSLQYDLVLNLLSNSDDTIFEEFYDESDLKDELLAVKKIKDYPLYLAYEIDLDKVRSAALHLSMTGGILTFLSSVITLTLLVLILRRILTPLKTLEKSVGEVAKGNLNQDVNIQTGDEIEDLSRAYNRMIEELRNLYGNLNEQVNKKTQDLENNIKELRMTNKYMVNRELKMIELKEEIESLNQEIFRLKTKLIKKSKS